MTEEQYKEILRQIGVVANNQIILSDKINALQSDIVTVLNNQEKLATFIDNAHKDIKKLNK
jgi:methionine salvage enolase-phosphatase E1